MTPGRPAASRLTAGDRLLGAAIFVASVVWFALQPRNLGHADESYILVEASRIVGGERLYRDMFEIIMPGTQWLVAAAFALFGTTITTAKMTIAAVNATTAALVFASARALGVRATVALVPPLAFLAVAQPAWPYVSPHWVSTALIVALLLIAAPPQALERPRRLLTAGLVLGTLGAVQQQKAPAIAAGLGAAILLASWIRRDPAAPRWDRRLALVAVGALLVVGPVLAFLFATVDAQQLLDATVRFPLTGYRNFHHVSWGEVSLLTLNLAAYVWLPLLRALPLLLPLGGAVATAGCLRGWPRARVVQWSTLLVLCGAAVLAVGYFDDFIHIAFIAPPFFILAALLLDTLLALAPARAQAVAAAVVAALLALALGGQMARNAARMRAEYPLVTDTHFGRVAFESHDAAETAQQLARLLERAPRREFFAYPTYASLYLTAGGRNPTPFELLYPGYNRPQHFADVQATLEARQVPIVVVSWRLLPRTDAFAASLAPTYEVAVEGKDWTIYRRRGDGDTAPPS